MSTQSCQQFELYAAEAAIDGGGTIAPADLQRWVDELRDLPWWERNFPQVLRVETHVRRSNRDGSVGGWHPEDGCGQIEMAPVHLTPLYVLHEVAHVLAAARYGSHSHDPWFARTYLELVSVRLGSGMYEELYRAFERGHIDHDTESSAPAGIPLPAGRRV